MKKIVIIVSAVILIVALVVFWKWDAIHFARVVGKKYDTFEYRTGKVADIVLVNIGEGDRKYLAQVLNQVADCNPSVVGMDVFFTKPKERTSDYQLAEAISKSPTILGIEPKGDYFTVPYALFMGKAVDVALPVITKQFDLALSYEPFIRSENGGDTFMEHFSVTVTKYYDSLRTSAFVSKLDKGQNYLINYEVTQDNFQVYEYQDTNFNCSDFEGKIVLLGYLGPTNEDKFRTPLGLVDDPMNYNAKKGDMYGVVIIANQILTILEGQELTEY